VRARRRIQKPDVFAEGLSPVQSYLMQDDWRHEVSTFDKQKDTYYKPAFLKDIMDKYSWGAQGILESYADYIKLKTKIDLTEEKLASYVMQSQMCPWVFEFVTAAYNDKVLKAYLDDSSLNETLKTAIASGKWDIVVDSILSDLTKSDYPLAQEVGNRYNIALAQTRVKHVSLKPRMDKQPGEEIEADLAPPAAPQPPAPPAHPGTAPTAPTNPTSTPQNNNQNPNQNPNNPNPNMNQQQEEVVQADDEHETGEAELTIKFKPEVKTEEQPEEVVEIIEAEDPSVPSDKDNAITDMVDVSNPMGYPYKNVGVSPNSPDWPPLGRPYELYPQYNDPYRNPSPESLKMQWI